MASGKLGSAAPAADTDTTVYTVPSATVATVNVSVVNRGADAATVRVAITSAASPAAADWVEYDAPVPGAGGVLERTALVAGAGEKIIVRANTANCTVRVHGFEGAS